jgi:hypothetical protein
MSKSKFSFNRLAFLAQVIAFVFISESMQAQDSIKTEKRKWLPTIKLPSKGKKRDEADSSNWRSKLTFWKKDKPDSGSVDTSKLSKLFGLFRKEVVDTLKFHESFSLGIGTIIDSATNITESFEILRFFQMNPIILEGRKIPVKLVSHPSQASLVVTGTIRHHYVSKCSQVGRKEKCDAYETICDFNIWKNGYKVSSLIDYQIVYPDKSDLNFLTEDVSLNYPLYDGSFRVIRFGLDKLYRSLFHYSGQDEKVLLVGEDIENIMDCSALNEFKYKLFKRRKPEKRDLAELLPGNVKNFGATFDTLHTRFIRKEKFIFQTERDFKQLGLSANDPVDIANLTNALYRYVDNNEFRNINSSFVPENFKMELVPIIAPKSAWVGAPISYLVAANKFMKEGDWAAAEMTYEACMYLTSKTNTSFQVKQELRLLAAKGLLTVAVKQGRKVTQQYLELVINLIDDYLQSNIAIQVELDYRADIKQFQDLCLKIDKQISDLKGNNIAGKIVSVAEVVGGALLRDPSLSRNSGTKFVKATETKSKGKNAMLDELAKIELKKELMTTIDANKVKEIESGSIYLSKLVWDVLYAYELNENSIKYLKQFAIDKPATLQKIKLLESSNVDMRSAALKDLVKKLIDIEKSILKYEKQDQIIPNKF